MKQRMIYITEQDMERLRELLRTAQDPTGKDRPYLETLRAELDRATIVAQDAVTPDVVTMNTTLKVCDPDGGRVRDLTVVFPERASSLDGRTSVISPLGAALLGFRAGDSVTFTTPIGPRTCKIVSVLYQPEAAGDLHL